MVAGLGVESVAQESPPEPADAVGPLIRGLTVIRTLTELGGALGPPELCRQVGLARSTLDRVLATLEAMGYVRFQHRDVMLAPRLMELGNAFLGSVRIPALLGPLAEQLSGSLDEAVTLSVTGEDGAHLVHQTSRPRKLALACRVGDRLPLDACAGGALYAATWGADRWKRYQSWHECHRGPDQIRACADDLRRRAREAGRRGWALDDQWLEPGLIAVGMPVCGPDGTERCTVNVISFTSRHATAADLAGSVLPGLEESVRRMEDALRTADGAPAGSGGGDSGSGRGLETGPGVLESLTRGLAVLAAFGARQPTLSIADAARATDLPRATVRRALITLEHLGYASHTHGRYRPTPTVLRLGYPVLSRLTLAQIATPHLAALSARVGHSASLAVLEAETEIMYVARAATGARLTAVDIHIGTRLPAYATAMGRVLLAGLPVDERARALRAAHPARLTARTVTDTGALLALLKQVGDHEYCHVEEELEAGLRSIAVPVRGHDGRTLAAINVAMHAGRRADQNAVAEVLPPLRAAADGIRQDLVAVGPFNRLTVL